MRGQGTSAAAALGAEAGKPALMNESSFPETEGCSSGESRAIKNQTAPANKPTAAQTRKDARQPYRNIKNVISGGVNPAPTPTPEKISPFAKPRSELGIHRETNWF